MIEVSELHYCSCSTPSVLIRNAVAHSERDFLCRDPNVLGEGENLNENQSKNQNTVGTNTNALTNREAPIHWERGRPRPQWARSAKRQLGNGSYPFRKDFAPPAPCGRGRPRSQ